MNDQSGQRQGQVQGKMHLKVTHGLGQGLALVQVQEQTLETFWGLGLMKLQILNYPRQYL